MAKRPTLTDITSLTNSSAINALSENWDAIEDAFDNTLRWVYSQCSQC